jgi:hypothetical protein
VAKAVRSECGYFTTILERDGRALRALKGDGREDASGLQALGRGDILRRAVIIYD